MKLGFYHYYFRERRRDAPRICHDIRPLLNVYLQHDDVQWKNKIENEDGEKLLLLTTPHKDVLMLVGTRQHDIIKAINIRDMSCADIAARLQQDEKAGFACYFCCDGKKLGLAATLRGPKTAALARFVNYLVKKLGAEEWGMHLQALGSSITLEQARGMAFVSRTSIRVSAGSDLFRRLKEFFARDSEDVASFEVVIRGKVRRNLKHVLLDLAANANKDGLDRFTIRARSALDDDLADYFVGTDGRLGEELGPGNESQITHAVANRFAHHAKAGEILREMLLEAHYENRDVPELTRLGDAAHWQRHLRA